jgi:nucleoside-diphosphate kinase
MVEHSLVFIKPDGVGRRLVGRILQRFEDRGFVIKGLTQLTLTDAQIDGHYVEHVSKGFYPELKAYMKSGPIVAFVVEGPNAVSIIRKMVGVTNAGDAEAGTIRGDFALTTAMNIIHASDSVESAQREILNLSLNF